MAPASAVARLAALHPGCEIWWDSSPLIFERWRQELLAAPGARPALEDELQRLRDPRNPTSGVIRASTTNPPLTWQAIEGDHATWDKWLAGRARQVRDPEELLWQLYGEVVDRGAALLEPTYQASKGRYGHICGQVDPRSLTDLGAMLPQAHRLHALRPNVMIKMPATKEGIEGIRILSREGIATTATLCFSVAQLVAVAEAARVGYREARERGVDMTGARCCAALMLGRMEDVPVFKQQAAERGITLDESDLRWAGVAVARQAYRLYCERGYEARLLLASMRLGPTVDGETRIWHLEQVAGGEMVLTVFPNIMASFLELYADREQQPRIAEPIPAQVLEKLLRIPYFVEAYEEHALAPEQFVDLPGVQATGAGFAQAMDSIAHYAAAALR